MCVLTLLSHTCLPLSCVSVSLVASVSCAVWRRVGNHPLHRFTTEGKKGGEERWRAEGGNAGKFGVEQVKRNGMRDGQ